MATHTHEHRVEWGETDAAGIVFYPNYFRWFDQATHELFRNLGIPLEPMAREERSGPIIIEARCQLVAPLFYDDVVQIEACIAELRTRAFRVEYVVRRGEQIVATGYEVRIWAHVSGRGIEPVAIPAVVRQSLEA
jgi:4-hydroxybenzoyl-CoA thioesterase